MRYFNGVRLAAENLIGDPPHLKHLEKSLPVPIGIIPNAILSILTPVAYTKDTTHKTVPSPPHTITLIE